jgi:multicomponent Na+:H+ antiporter subunit D
MPEPIHWLPLAPILVPLVTAIVCLLLRGWTRAERAASVAGALANLAAATWLLGRVWQDGVQVVQSGGWPAPFGISIAVDTLGGTMAVITGLVGLCGVIYSLAEVDRERQRFGFWPLLHVLLMGVGGAFVTGDLFNLYVWIEVLLIASFALLALGNERRQLDGAVRYVLLNLVGSTTFLAGIGLLFSLTGTLNFADLARRAAEVQEPALLGVAGAVLLVALGLKAALFPLYFWLPASYPVAPFGVAAVFAGLMTKIGVYGLLRVFTLVLPADAAAARTLLLVGAGGSMLVGGLGALSERRLRRVFSFQLIAAVGYMLMGLGLHSQSGLTAAAFYLVEDIVVITALFLVAGLVHRAFGTEALDAGAGLFRDRPALAALFFVPAFSLAGLPPLSGFWGKLLLIRAGLERGNVAIVVVALVAASLTLLAMGQVWSLLFWRPAAPTAGDPAVAPPRRLPAALMAPTVFLVVLALSIGLYARPAYVLAARIGAELADPSGYVRAVLGPSP